MSVEKGLAAYGPGSLLQIISNLFSTLIQDRLCKESEQFHSDQVKVAICVRYFGILVKGTVGKMMGKGVVAERYKVMSKFWKEALGLASYYYKKNKTDLPMLETIESEMTKAFQEYAVKLNEE